jgi:branched-chain amino acid transport system substrate-binding protein
VNPSRLGFAQAAARGWAALCALLLLAAATPVGVRGAEPYRINAIVSLTGSAAFLGREAAQTLGILERTVNRSGGINGTPIAFVVYDDESNPQIATQLAGNVIAGGAPIIIGSEIVAACNAIAALVHDGPLVYCLSPGIHPERGSYVFSSGASTADAFGAAMRYFHHRNWTRIAILNSTDATGQDADRVIDAAFRANPGMTLVAHEHFNLADISVGAQIAKVEASHAQVLMAWATGTPLGTILRGATESGLDIPIETTGANLTYAQMAAYRSYLPKELLIAATPPFAPEQLPRGSLKDAVGAFIAALKASGTRPENGSALTWDTGLLLIDALKKLGVGASAAQLRAYLAQLRGDVGIYGTHDFPAIPQRGLGIDANVMVRWDPAKGTWAGLEAPRRTE